MPNNIVKQINNFMRLATKSEKDNIKKQISPSERQEQIFELKYVHKKDINYIADLLSLSPSVINNELKNIREKVRKIL